MVLLFTLYDIFDEAETVHCWEHISDVYVLHWL
jgi:hypothetical protein